MPCSAGRFNRRPGMRVDLSHAAGWLLRLAARLPNLHKGTQHHVHARLIATAQTLVPVRECRRASYRRSTDVRVLPRCHRRTSASSHRGWRWSFGNSAGSGRRSRWSWSCRLFPDARWCCPRRRRPTPCPWSFAPRSRRQRRHINKFVIRYAKCQLVPKIFLETVHAQGRAAKSEVDPWNT